MWKVWKKAKNSGSGFMSLGDTATFGKLRAAIKPAEIPKPPKGRKNEDKQIKDEYILAKGIPVFSLPVYDGGSCGYRCVAMAHSVKRVLLKPLVIPPELEYENLPKFELVLRQKKSNH